MVSPARSSPRRRPGWGSQRSGRENTRSARWPAGREVSPQSVSWAETTIISSLQLRPAEKTAPIQVGAGRIFAKPHHVIAGHGHHQRISLVRAVILREEIAVMDLSALALENLLPESARSGCRPPANPVPLGVSAVCVRSALDPWRTPRPGPRRTPEQRKGDGLPGGMMPPQPARPNSSRPHSRAADTSFETIFTLHSSHLPPERESGGRPRPCLRRGLFRQFWFCPCWSASPPWPGHSGRRTGSPLVQRPNGLHVLGREGEVEHPSDFPPSGPGGWTWG